MRIGLGVALAAMVALLISGAALAQDAPRAAPVTMVTVEKLPPPHVENFDPEKATNAYLAQVSGKARAQSDAYFDGKYVLGVVDLLYGLVVAGLFLFLRISSAMRNIAQGITRSRFWQAPIYVIQYIVVATAAGLPLTIYEDFLREHAYGLSNQTFIAWAGDFGINFAVNLIGMTIFLTVLYAIVRGSRRMWWLWGSVIAVIFLAIQIMIDPVFIAPLTNHYQPLKDGPVKTEILQLARANGIPANNIYEFDESRQDKRISANVSGMFGTTQISLNDNLINRCNPREIMAVMAHEMGHYVLDHSAVLLTWFGLVFFVGFVFVNWGYAALTDLFGGNWDVRTIDDPAGLPLVIALVSVFFFVMTPVMNTITRTVERQADIFGLNAARQPDGEATVDLKLSEYRKLDPSPLEEFLFYDHPSGRSRILMAMRWKAAHIDDPDIAGGPVSPQ
jgi:STE24 endopeptidase